MSRACLYKYYISWLLNIPYIYIIICVVFIILYVLNGSLALMKLNPIQMFENCAFCGFFSYSWPFINMVFSSVLYQRHKERYLCLWSYILEIDFHFIFLCFIFWFIRTVLCKHSVHKIQINQIIMFRLFVL